MTKLNVRLNIMPRVFKLYDDGKSHILEVKADTVTGKAIILMDGVRQEDDPSVKVTVT